MLLRAGMMIEATDALADDPVFSGARIYLKECGSDGAVGAIVNRPFGRALNELEEFRQQPPVPLFYGGPVDGDHLFFLHRRPELIDGSTRVADGVCWGGNFRQALRALASAKMSAEYLQIFVGYCGWDAGELESELAEGSWRLTADAYFLLRAK